MFLMALVRKDEAYTKRMADELNKIYAKNPTTWQILCMILNLDPKYRNYGERLVLLREKFEMEEYQNHILPYIEAYICYQERSSLLKLSLIHILPLVLAGKKYEEMEKRLAPIAKQLGITELLNKFPYEVSGCLLYTSTLSAISANLGDVTAATITNKRDGENAIILNSESIAFYDWANEGQYAGKISSGHIGGTSSQPELDIVSEGPLILSAEGYSYAFANDDLRIGDTAILEAINELNRKLNFRIVTKQKAISISNSNAFDVFLSSEVPGALFVAACIQNKTPDIWLSLIHI